MGLQSKQVTNKAADIKKPPIILDIINPLFPFQGAIFQAVWSSLQYFDSREYKFIRCC